MREELKAMFASVQADLGDLAAKITLADSSEHSVIAPSISLSRTSSEQGESESPDVVIRMLYDDYAAANIQKRDVVLFTNCCGDETRVRIREVSNTGGIMRMLCEAVYG